MQISDFTEDVSPVSSDYVETQKNPGGHSRKVQLGNIALAVGDKNFIQAFTSQTTVTVTHNLGKRPAVTIIDSANDECEGDVVHTSINQLVVTFSASFSGTVICN